MDAVSNQRVHPRISISGKIKFSFIAFKIGENGKYEEDISIIETQIRDISLGGISFEDVRSYEPGMKGYIFIVIGRRRYALVGEVVRCISGQNAYQVGIALDKNLNDDGMFEPSEEIVELIQRLEVLLEHDPNYTNIT